MNQPPSAPVAPKTPIIAPWLLITAIIVLLIGGGYLGYYFWSQSKINNTEENKKTTTNNICPCGWTEKAVGPYEDSGKCVIGTLNISVPFPDLVSALSYFENKTGITINDENKKNISFLQQNPLRKYVLGLKGDNYQEIISNFLKNENLQGDFGEYVDGYSMKLFLQDQSEDSFKKILSYRNFGAQASLSQTDLDRLENKYNAVVKEVTSVDFSIQVTAGKEKEFKNTISSEQPNYNINFVYAADEAPVMRGDNSKAKCYRDKTK